MFKAENTGTTTWKQIIDSSGKHIANLDENYHGDWILSGTKTRDKLTEEIFSNGAKAANWLWKNRLSVGEPYSLYEDEKKKKTKQPEIVETIEDITSEDLFRNMEKPKRK